jgi:adenine-specific DNA-methyltransferase
MTNTNMKKIDLTSPEAQSADLVADNIAQLKALFPELVSEGPKGTAISLDVLKALVGDVTVTDVDEKYGLNWHGKRRARQLALTTSTGTLRPCPEESVDWDNTRNLMIEGDNLEVLKLLQKSYAGKIKLIYIDPPYNTGKDFVYPDNFRDGIGNYLEITGQSEDGRKLSSNPETSGRFHTEWLNMIYPRLKLARGLLRMDGMIFVSIDDGEVTRCMEVLSEIFGEENFIATFIWKRKAGGGDDSGHVAAEHEYVLCFARDLAHAEVASVLHESPSMTAKYNRQENGRRYYLERLDKTSLTYSKSMDFEIECPDGTWIAPPQPDPTNPTTGWRWGKETVKARRSELTFQKDRLGHWRIYTKTWEPSEGVTPRSLLVDKAHGRNRDGTQELDRLIGPKIFNNPKPTKILEHLFKIGASGAEDIILDFFAGSGSTGHTVMKLNAADSGKRRFILVQLPERTGRSDFPTIASITRARLKKSGEEIKPREASVWIDVGFRSFRLDSSNIRAWSATGNDLKQTLLENEYNLLGERSEDDFLYELLLKLGLDLCVPIQQRVIVDKSVHAVGAGVLLACLAESITASEVETLADGLVQWHQQLAPAGETTCVFRDSAFADDVAKTNMAAILQQHGIQNVRSL